MHTYHLPLRTCHKRDHRLNDMRQRRLLGSDIGACQDVVTRLSNVSLIRKRPCQNSSVSAQPRVYKTPCIDFIRLSEISNYPGAPIYNRQGLVVVWNVPQSIASGPCSCAPAPATRNASTATGPPHKIRAVFPLSPLRMRRGSRQARGMCGRERRFTLHVVQRGPYVLAKPVAKVAQAFQTADSQATIYTYLEARRCSSRPIVWMSSTPPP
jgi:hypothetical protein